MLQFFYWMGFKIISAGLLSRTSFVAFVFLPFRIVYVWSIFDALTSELCKSMICQISILQIFLALQILLVEIPEKMKLLVMRLTLLGMV